MTQEQRVLEYMKTHRGITALEAYRELGVMRLSARIFDLRASGHVIATEHVPVMNRFGEQVYVTRYKAVAE